MLSHFKHTTHPINFIKQLQITCQNCSWISCNSHIYTLQVSNSSISGLVPWYKWPRVSFEEIGESGSLILWWSVCWEILSKSSVCSRFVSCTFYGLPLLTIASLLLASHKQDNAVQICLLHNLSNTHTCVSMPRMCVRLTTNIVTVWTNGDNFPTWSVNKLKFLQYFRNLRKARQYHIGKANDFKFQEVPKRIYKMMDMGIPNFWV